MPKINRKQIWRYELSKDKLGLIAFFEDREINYHIHSNELTLKETRKCCECGHVFLSFWTK